MRLDRRDLRPVRVQQSDRKHERQNDRHDERKNVRRGHSTELHAVTIRREL
jgi:hypothetical protein